MRSLVTPLLLSFLVLSSTASAEQLAPDTELESRRLATLQALAAEYEPQDRYTSCYDFGKTTISLVARLELGERGAQGGIELASADAEVRALAGEAVRLAGAAGAPCTWEEAGSPGTMHGLLGLAMILHRYRDGLDEATVARIEQAAAGHWRKDIGPYLVNANIAIIAGRLLAGESMGYDSAVWQEGLRDFEEVYGLTTTHGGLEMNAPIYTAYQFAALIPLMELRDTAVRQKARILLDYLFLVQAHLYLPGGGLGAPQSRDYAGGARDEPSTLQRIFGLYAGEPSFAPSGSPHLIGAATSYKLPEVIRSIFLDKGPGGYGFSAYTPAPVVSAHGRGYDFAGDPMAVAPWQGFATEDVIVGVNHGFRYQSIHVSMGAQVRAPDGQFPTLYHQQPYLVGDTTGRGGGLPSSGGDDEPGDFVRELYDYRRMIHGRALIQLWNPTTDDKPADIVRQAPYTQVHIPDWAAHGAEMRADQGGWFVGKLGGSLIAYRPLGTISQGPELRPDIPGPTGRGIRASPHYYVRLDGRSGGILEVVDADRFATLDAYVADLQRRHLVFEPGGNGQPMWAEFDTLDPATGQLTRMRLEYDGDRRSIDGTELTPEQALGHGLLDSPFARLDGDSRQLIVARGCMPSMVYDLEAGTVTERPVDPTCQVRPADTTIFSDVPVHGDLASYTPEHAERWLVIEDGEEEEGRAGQRRLMLAPFAFEKRGDRLGEVALLESAAVEDFRIELRAKTRMNLIDEPAADYAIVFGYQDEQNYMFLLANGRADYSELFALEDGTRRQIALAKGALIPDEGWHDLELTRQGDQIRVLLDDQLVLEATSDAFPSGRVGIGTLNDSSLFDDIALHLPGGDATPDAGGGQAPDMGQPPGPSAPDAGGASTPDDGAQEPWTQNSGEGSCRAAPPAGDGGPAMPAPLVLALMAAMSVVAGRPGSARRR